jgi:glycosyltransferase involved in cell wall biosynthesis
VLRCPTGDKKCMAKNVISIIENQSLRFRLRMEAKKYSSNYDWRNVVKAEKEAYQKVIKRFTSKSILN